MGTQRFVVALSARKSAVALHCVHELPEVQA
jgi:hypothetical protein